MKANSNLRILSLLRQAGAGFDVVSGGEMARALRAGAISDQIVFSGVGKSEAEIDAGLEAGIGMFNVESAGELELIENRAAALQRIAPVAIRVNPEVETETHPYISTGQIIHKFGVPKDEALELYRRASASAHLKIRGVACHIGSQILAVEPFLKALDEILALAERLESQGIGIEYIDLGGGYGIRYADEQPLEFETLGRGLEDRLQGARYRLIVEPGRALVAKAGILLTRVLYVKQNRRKNFIIVDAGMNDLMRPTLYGSYHEIIPVRDQNRGMLEADVVGPLCETGDFFAQDRQMPGRRTRRVVGSARRRRLRLRALLQLQYSPTPCRSPGQRRQGRTDPEARDTGRFDCRRSSMSERFLSGCRRHAPTWAAFSIAARWRSACTSTCT